MKKRLSWSCVQYYLQYCNSITVFHYTLHLYLLYYKLIQILFPSVPLIPSKNDHFSPNQVLFGLNLIVSNVLCVKLYF